MKKIQVMLVDDEVEFLDTLTKRLRKRGVNITGVESGEEALQTLGHGQYDVVILDVRMPGLDGIEVLRVIKERYPLMEVIMLTGHANVEVAVQGMELGAFDYLMKPMDIDELLYKVEDAFKKKQIQEDKLNILKEMKHSTERDMVKNR
ncbi:response regulator [Thermodesulfobacteriota bacterium]